MCFYLLCWLNSHTALDKKIIFCWFCFLLVVQKQTLGEVGNWNDIWWLVVSGILVTSNLSKAHETRDSLAVPVRRLFWSISIHFVAIHSWNLRRSHKLQKTHLLFWEFKVIRSHQLNSSWLVLLITSSMLVSICNLFHAKRANSGKIATF